MAGSGSAAQRAREKMSGILKEFEHKGIAHGTRTTVTNAPLPGDKRYDSRPGTARYHRLIDSTQRRNRA